MTHLSNIIRASAAVAALFVAACAAPINGPDASLDVSKSFPITVEPRMMTLHMPYNGPAAGLDQNMNAQLSRFAADYLDRGSGAIAVSAPRRFPNAPNYFAQRLIELGVPRERILIGNEDASDANSDVKLTYIRYEAETPACGNWSVNLASTAANKVPPNFGCATQHNIAAAVADPRDLVSPRPLDPDDAQRRLSVLDKYRKGETTVAQKTEEQSAAVSDVGNM